MTIRRRRRRRHNQLTDVGHLMLCVLTGGLWLPVWTISVSRR